MNTIRKPNILHLTKDQPTKIQRYESPGPGSYQIALPLIRPNYQAIHKKNDVIILKVNHIGQSSNFRNNQDRFPKQLQKSPGPAQYHHQSLSINKKKQNKRYSQRYSDLMQFMKKDRVKMSPVPDYKVNYDDQYETAIKKIKNSHRKYKQKIVSSKLFPPDSNQFTNRSISTMNNIINIKSSSRLSDVASQFKNDGQFGGKQEQGKKSEMRTIDFPQNSSKITPCNKLFSLQKQQKLNLHRVTLYNRNMLGMLISKHKKGKVQKQKQIKIQLQKQTIDNTQKQTLQN